MKEEYIYIYIKHSYSVHSSNMYAYEYVGNNCHGVLNKLEKKPHRQTLEHSFQEQHREEFER